MSDHDGHTINVGPVTVGIETDAIRANYCDVQKRANWQAYIFGDVGLLCAEVDRLRAENTALRAEQERLRAMVRYWRDADSG